MWKKAKKGLAVVLAVALVLTGVFSLYVGDYYHADLEAIETMSMDVSYEKMERLADGSLVFYPEEYDTGLIFYPGGKVECAAYMTLMEYCAQEGIPCVLMPMPFNLAVLSIYGSADGVMNREKYEQYRANLPADCVEVILEGGNHAIFGVYGAQEGDGEAAISNLEQIRQTAQAIAEFVK